MIMTLMTTPLMKIPIHEFALHLHGDAGQPPLQQTLVRVRVKVTVRVTVRVGVRVRVRFSPRCSRPCGDVESGRLIMGLAPPYIPWRPYMSHACFNRLCGKDCRTPPRLTTGLHDWP